MADKFTPLAPLGGGKSDEKIGFVAAGDGIGALSPGAAKIGENVDRIGRVVGEDKNNSKYDKWAQDVANRGAMKDLTDPTKSAEETLKEHLGRIHARLERLQLHVSEHGTPSGFSKEVRRLDSQREALTNQLAKIHQAGAVRIAKHLQHVQKLFPTRLETKQRIKDAIPPELDAIGSQPPTNGAVLTITAGKALWKAPDSQGAENPFVGLVYYPGGTEPYNMGLPPYGTTCFVYDSLASTVAGMFYYSAEPIANSTEARPLIHIEHMRWPFFAYRFGG